MCVRARACVCMCTRACAHTHVQSHLTLCHCIDYSPPASSIRGIFQPRILKWVAISYCRGSSQPRDRTHVSCVSCIGRQIPYQCATWEAHIKGTYYQHHLSLLMLTLNTWLRQCFSCFFTVTFLKPLGESY